MMLVAWLMAIAAWAQDNGLNPVYKIQIGDITYEKGEASKKVTVGKVLGVVADAVEGRVTDIHNEEYIPLAANSVMEGLTHVRRLQTVEADEVEGAKYLVTATLTDITASRKVKTYDRKDSKGREYTEMKTYYDMRLLDFAQANLVHDQFGQKRPIPKNGGKTIEFRSFSPLAKATTPLTEGVTPSGNQLDVKTITATVAQYGDFIVQSDVLELTAVDNTILEATKLLGRQAGVTLDTITRNILVGGTNVMYAPKINASTGA